MKARTGSRAASARSLISGRAYSGLKALDKRQINIRLDYDLVILLEQYGICSLQGKHGLPCMSEWVTDVGIEKIREKKKARENKLNYPG